MGKKLTLAWMLVVALSIIVPLTGATMYAEDRPAVTAPLSVALESNIEATDVVLAYRVTPGSIVEPEAPSACGVSGSMVPPTAVGSYLRSLGCTNAKLDRSFVTTMVRTNATIERRVLLLWRHLTSS